MKTKATKQRAPALSPEFTEACAEYAKLAERAATVAGKAERASWERAAAALAVKKVCEKESLPYLTTATSKCNVSRPVATMDAHAEEMHIRLKYPPSELAVGSLTAMYELHRGSAAIALLAGKSTAAKAEADKRIEEIGLKIADGEMSSREVRRAFADEVKRAKAQKRLKKGGAKRTAPVAIAVSPTVRPLNLDGVHEMFERLAPDGAKMPMVTIKPSKPTAKGVKEYLSDPEHLAQIAAACPKEGGFWIFVDLKATEKPKSQTKAAA